MLIYKRDKGNASRGIGVAALGGVALFGCRELYQFLMASALPPVPGGLGLRWADLVVGLVGAGCALGIFLLLNNHKVVDFLIETEAELKKVSWSPPKQVFSNTVVVIVSVVFLAFFVVISDKVISQIILLILS